MSPNSETDFGAHMRCAHCHCVRPKNEVIFVGNLPVCIYGNCLENMKGKRHALLTDRLGGALIRNGGGK